MTKSGSAVRRPRSFEIVHNADGQQLQPGAPDRCIITFVYYLTKNMETRAVFNKVSETVADFFWEEICRHGNVARVISDQGSELSNSFEELLDKCFIDHCLTSPHHPQSNGLTERFNKKLTIILRRLVAHHPEDWAMHLSATLIGYMGSIQLSIRFTSFYQLMATRCHCL